MIAALMATASAFGQAIVYWDTNSSTAGSSGGTTAAGTWNQNTTANWTTNSGGTTSTSTWQTASGGSGIATFSAGSNATGSYTVNVAGTITGVRGLTFEEGTVLLSGGTLSLGGNATINTNANNAAIGSTISGGFGITKIGSGTLTLSGANSYTGTTTIGSAGGASGGTLALGSTSVIPSTAVTIYAGTLSMGANNDTIGGLNLGGGASGTTAAVTGSGTLTLGGDVTFSATNNANGASIGSNLALGANRVFNVGDSTAAAADLTVSGVISGTNTGINKQGSGTLVLSGANTNTGVTTVTAGTLSVSSLANGGSASGLGASSNAAGNLVLNGGTLQYTGAGNTTNRLFTLGIAGGALDASGSGAVTFSNTGNLGMSGSGNRVLTLTGSNTANNTLASVIVNGSGGVTSVNKTGSGTWVLTGANTYSGNTTITDGTLAFTQLSSLGNSGNTLIIDGGALRYTGSSSVTTSRIPVIGANGGTIEASGSGTIGFTSGSNLAFTGTGARTLTLAGSNTGNNAFNVVIRDAGVGAATTVVKEGSGTWLFDGNNANTYTGDTIVNAGTLLLDKKSGRDATGLGNIIIGDGVNVAKVAYLSTSNQLDNSANIFLNYNGTFDLNGRTDSVGGIGDGAYVTSGFGEVKLGAGSLTVGASNLTSTFSGVISGTGSVTSTGSGTWTLAGNNTFSGGLSVTAGGLNINHAGALGTGQLTLAGGVAFDNTSGAAIVNANANAVRINGNVTFGGSNAYDFGAGTTTLGANSTLTVNGSTLTVSGVLTDGGSTYALTKAGAGTLMLSGANTYTGATRVNAGVLAVNTLGNGGVASSIGNSNNAATNLVLNGGTLRYTGAATSSNRLFSIGSSGGTIETAGSGQLSFTNTGAIGFNSQTGARTLTLSGSGDGSIAASIGDNSGATSILKSGTGTWTLSGNSSYTGSTSITGGTLVIAGNNALGSTAGSTTVSNGATLGVQGGITYAAAEPVTLTGSGALGRAGAIDNLSGANSIGASLTISGNSTIAASAGSLTLSGPINLTGAASADTTLTLTTVAGSSINVTGQVTDALALYSLSLRHLGSGVVTLSNGTNDYFGNTTIGAAGSTTTGTLRLGANNALPAINPTSLLTIYSGTLDLNNFNAVAYGAASNGSASNLSLVLGGGGAGSTAAITTGTGTLNIKHDIYYDATNNANGATISGNISLQSGSHKVTVNDSSAATADLTISANISDAGGPAEIDKYGTGTLVLSGANTYSSLTAIHQGVLNIRSNTALGSTAGITTVSSGASLQMQGGITVTGESLTLSGSGFGGNGALHNVLGNNTWAGAVTLSTTNARIQADAGTLLTIQTGAITSSTGGSLEVGGAGNTRITSNIGSGVTGLTKKDAGTLTLSGNNALSGPVAIQGGTVSMQSNSALGFSNNVSISNGATLAFDSTANGNLNTQVSAVSVTGAGVGGAGALRNTAGTNLFNGSVNLTGSTTVTADAGSRLTISGTISSTGSNTLTVGSSTAGLNGSVTLTGSLTNATGTMNLTKLGAASGSDGRLTISGGGTIGTVNLSQGAMTVSSTPLNTGAFTAAAGTSLLVASGGTLNISGAATFNSGTLDAASGGTLAISGNTTATFLGSNSASSLNLKLGGSSTGGTFAGALTVYLGSNLTVGTLEITGDTILDFGNSGSSILTSGALLISNNAQVRVVNWSSTTNPSTSDIWYALSTVQNTTLGSTNQTPGSNAGLGQITFVNPQGSVGNTTTWVADTSTGWYDHEIRPTPEPATYGAILISSCLGLLGFQRFKRRKQTK